MLSELTEKQSHFLAYLEKELARRKKAPSLRRAAEAFGVSHSAILQLMRSLEEKGYVKRQGRYSRTILLLNRAGEAAAVQRWREIPVIGRITAGLPMYAQQEWDGTLVVDAAFFRGLNLFALRVKGDSMLGAGILHDDLVICQPRQYAENGEIVVALIGEEEATVKRFFLHRNRMELRPENPQYQPLFYPFDQVLIQGKVVGLQRGPEGMERV